jgi:hypothetical protein
VIFFTLGVANGQTLSWSEVIVISMTAFHRRGFLATVFQPNDAQAAVAAVEALSGLLIEIILIATFTQRFFNKRGLPEFLSQKTFLTGQTSRIGAPP